MLCHDVQCNLGKIHICSNAAGGYRANSIPHILNDGFCQLLGGHVVHLQVVGNIDKRFVNGISVDVLRGNVLQKNAVDLCSTIYVQLHSGRGSDVFDIWRNIFNATPVLYTKFFHVW